MATITAPRGSFVQFENTDLEHCQWGTVRATLPVYSADDVKFQFFVTGTEDEIDELSNFYTTGVTVGLVGLYDELSEPTILEFAEEPERFKISDTVMLFNWTAGLPGFEEVVSVDECFKIQVTLNLSSGSESQTTNRFIRIGDNCYTSVLEYGNDDNAFGFNYCAAGDSPDPTQPPGGGGGGGGSNPPPTTCEPTAIEFTNLLTWQMPYTTQLQDAYGPTPTVQVWISDIDGSLVLSTIQAKMDAYPPTVLSFDFGGNASGVIIIK